MKCRQAKNLIFDHIDGMISEPDRVALEVHLNQCGDCESMASSLSRSLDLLHKLPSVEPSENFNWKVRLRLLKEKNALRDGVESERQWYRAWNTRFAVSAISAFAMVLVAGTVLMKSSIRPDGDPARFELRPEAMSQVAASQSSPPPTQTARSSTFNPRLFTGPTGVGPRPVSLGAVNTSAIPMAIEESSRPQLDMDSLKARYLRSRQEYYRVRQLEQQIDLLQSELSKCNMEKE